MSLQEQRAAIESYAQRSGIHISRWFEERETAAKIGRAVFDRMMDLLRRQMAVGVIIHKIDRSARNLRDWSDLGEMIDGGVEVHFANEALDLTSRGGRLSADIQAVVAADYIRNLRDEARKGMRGRYKQGLLPLPAPIGYTDQGGGKPKAIHPTQGPLVRRMFELYVTGKYTILDLSERMSEMGLRTKGDHYVKKSVISRMLANPFYYGVVRLQGTGELFEGRHKPLISQTLFRAAREVASERRAKPVVKHNFPYRRSIRCSVCGFCLAGETRKGIVYYRCHTVTCPTNTIRDDLVTQRLLERFAPLEICDAERQYLDVLIEEMSAKSREQRQEIVRALAASVLSVQSRMSRLMDAYLDDALDKEVIREKQKALLLERNELEGRLRDVQERQQEMTDVLRDFIDFAGSIRTIFESASPALRQRALRRIASRVSVVDKSVTVVLEKAYQLFASRPRVRSEELYGVSIFQASIPNSDADENPAVTIDQNNEKGRFAAEYDSSGSPRRDSLRTLLEEVGAELIKNAPTEVALFGDDTDSA